ncbi:metaxin 1 [Mortierella claussenii]|nr:metaxin 1 [Mortierella claussenii]
MQGYNADDKLSKEMKAKSVSYKALVDETLADALLFSWFADSDNFVGVVRKAYSALLPFPVRYYAPIEMKKRALRRVQKYGGLLESGGTFLAHTEFTKIYDAARECYKVLDRRLGQQDFFFGHTPTTLDAKVFGYLALQLFPEIPNPRFQMILQSQFPRLVAYGQRCRETFLKNTAQPSPLLSGEGGARHWMPRMLDPLRGLESIGFLTSWIRGGGGEPGAEGYDQGKDGSSEGDTQKKTKKEKTAEERDFERKRILAVVLGLASMVAYVIVNELVTIKISTGSASVGDDNMDEDLSVPVQTSFDFDEAENDDYS